MVYINLGGYFSSGVGGILPPTEQQFAKIELTLDIIERRAHFGVGGVLPPTYPIFEVGWGVFYPLL